MSTAVMNRRAEAPNSLDFFPTPPWATRALIDHVIDPISYAFPMDSVWEPAAGEGHMVNVLQESFPRVRASDVHDHGKGFEIGSFVGKKSLDLGDIAPDWIDGHDDYDWVITNPPFNLAMEFWERARDLGNSGCALLMRLNWLEGGARYNKIFKEDPPHVYVFSERVAMVKGRYDPEASSATAYAWFVWMNKDHAARTLNWFPPGTREMYERASDWQSIA